MVYTHNPMRAGMASTVMGGNDRLRNGKLLRRPSNEKIGAAQYMVFCLAIVVLRILKQVLPLLSCYFTSNLALKYLMYRVK